MEKEEEKKVEESTQEMGTQENNEGNSKEDFETMLKSNKAFQSEFDRRISQALETAKGKWQTEYDAKLADEIKKVQTESETSFNAKIAEYEEKIITGNKTIAEYQSRVLGFEKGVKKESIDDVISLASKYVTDEIPLDKAIDTVLQKYPVFANVEPKVEKVGKDVGAGYSNDKSQAEIYLEKTRRKKL